MGNVCGCASPQTKPAQQQQERQYTTSVGQSLQGKDVQNQSKKIGLAGTHQAVKLLGRGAAADIWLFRDLKHGNQVAVKLFERPLPQAAVQAVLREIKVPLTCNPFNSRSVRPAGAHHVIEHIDLLLCRYKQRLARDMPIWSTYIS